MDSWLEPLIALAREKVVPNPGPDPVRELTIASVWAQVANVRKLVNNLPVQVHGWLYELEQGRLVALDEPKP